jgi:hypothetical protein
MEMRLQSAMEYIITYGWAILILVIVIAALYALGVFNITTLSPNICSFPADIGCTNAHLDTSGLLTINVEQTTSTPINVTAIGCNTDGTTSNMILINPPNGNYIEIGGNETFTGIQCYQNYAPYNGVISSVYSGYVVLNYTDTQSGFEHVAVGKLVQKVDS